MTWQQTLLIAVAPALVTALALGAQQWAIARRAGVDREQDRADRERAAVAAVHLRFLIALAALWESIARARSYVYGQPDPTERAHLPQALRPAFPDQTILNEAYSALLLHATEEEVALADKAAVAFAEVVSMMGRFDRREGQRGSDAPMIVEFIEVDQRAIRTRREYAAAVRAGSLAPRRAKGHHRVSFTSTDPASP